MMKKVRVHCSSAETAVKSSESTWFFEKFLSKFEDFDNETRKKVLKVFKRIKQLEGISNEEYNEFLMFLNHKDIELILQECCEESLSIPEKKLESVSYDSLHADLISRLTNSRMIRILQGETFRTPVIEKEERKFVGVMEGSKQIYYEIQQDFKGYYICKNLKSGKTAVIWKQTFEHCYSDMGEVSIKKGPFQDMIIVNNRVIIYQCGSVSVTSSDNMFFDDKFFYYIIDESTSQIHRIDKKTFEHVVEGNSDWIFLVRNGRFIIGEVRQQRGSYILFEITGTIKQIACIDSFYQEGNGDIKITYDEDSSGLVSDGKLVKN